MRSLILIWLFDCEISQPGFAAPLRLIKVYYFPFLASPFSLLVRPLERLDVLQGGRLVERFAIEGEVVGSVFVLSGWLFTIDDTLIRLVC
jgi:hypothetical protein